MKIITPVADKPTAEKVYQEIEFPEHIKELYVYVKDGKLIVAHADKVDIPNEENKLKGTHVINFSLYYNNYPGINIGRFDENQISTEKTETKRVALLDLSE